jgi:hypothetical protein
MTCLAAPGIFPVKLVNQPLNVEFRAHPGIQLADTNFDSGTQFVDPLDSLQELAAKLLLRCFREGSGFGHGKLQGFGHIQSYHTLIPCRKPIG